MTHAKMALRVQKSTVSMSIVHVHLVMKASFVKQVYSIESNVYQIIVLSKHVKITANYDHLNSYLSYLIVNPRFYKLYSIDLQSNEVDGINANYKKKCF